MCRHDSPSKEARPLGLCHFTGLEFRHRDCVESQAAQSGTTITVVRIATTGQALKLWSGRQPIAILMSTQTSCLDTLHSLSGFCEAQSTGKASRSRKY